VKVTKVPLNFFALFTVQLRYLGRCGGLVVSQLVSGSSSPRLSPGQGHCVEDTMLAVPLSTQVYKWVTANLMLGVTCNGLISHPGGVEILLVASCYRKPG